ncbi:hypothetical protein HWV62_1204 [Athelia sp. TMB]|nr:hypothetical protein HWV62_1204 [Athelia sp. TMB]
MAVRLPPTTLIEGANSHWRQYFVSCLKATHPKIYWNGLSPRLLSIARSLFLFKAYTEVRFIRLFEHWIYPNRKRKALLIGIRAENDEDSVTLTGPHSDVKAMKGLLIKIYGYKEADITVMLDGHVLKDPMMEPTRENILREIDNLVRDAHYGDRFVFHFSGHSIQVPNRTGTEDDGLDEAIVPSDGDKQHIIDNILRKRLVDPLPVGSNLVAIFDTCHSASLLDLEHYRCNRVYVPWMTRVQSSMRIYEHRVRHTPGSNIYSHSSTSSTETNTSYTTSPPGSIIVNKRTQTRKTTLEVQHIDPHKHTTRALARVSVQTQLVEVSGAEVPKKAHMTTGLEMHRECEFVSDLGAETEEGPRGLDTIREVSEGAERRGRRDSSPDILGPEFKRSSSPTPVLKCDGFDMCNQESMTEMANVISLGACKDGQETWEAECGKSMTLTLVEKLEHDPHPCLKILMREISESTYETINRMHSMWMECKKAMSANGGAQSEDSYACGRDPLKEWQDPQLASHKKLDMDLPFTL